MLDYGKTSSSATNDTTPSSTQTDSADKGNPTLSSGAIAGISVTGILGGLAVFVLGPWLLVRRNRRRDAAYSKENIVKPNEETDGRPQKVGALQEKDGRGWTPEAEGDGLTHEKLGTPRYEAEGQERFVNEKPADREIYEI